MQIVVIFKLVMFICLIPLTFKSVSILDFDRIFRSHTNPTYKQLFYMILTLVFSYVLSDALSFILETMLGVIK